MEQAYVILDGVRRAKAAFLAGHTTIWASIDGECEEKIALELLLSPKRVIDVSSPEKLQRWTEICDGMALDPDLLPAINITHGRSGVPIVDVPLGGPRDENRK